MWQNDGPCCSYGGEPGTPLGNARTPGVCYVYSSRTKGKYGVRTSRCPIGGSAEADCQLLKYISILFYLGLELVKGFLLCLNDLKYSDSLSIGIVL